MDLGIQGRVALVCGGSRGIGQAICQELAKAGCQLAVIARNPQSLEASIARLEKNGARAIGISADLSDIHSYQQAVDKISTIFGPPDIAIFNGLSPKSGSFEDLDIPDFVEAHHMLVSCFAAMVKAVIPAMKQKKWGRIVTIGSNVSKQPFRGDRDTAYALANTERVAAVGLSKTLSAEFAPHGITINTILTGAINTESARAWCSLQAQQAGISDAAFQTRFIHDRIPVGRMGTPQEMATLCAFLCATHAGYTTGETILCDGGASMALQ